MDRRRVMKGAAWSVPVIAAAAAAPAHAASPLCSVNLSWTTATFVRTSATLATFTWTNPFGVTPAKNLVLTVSASQVGTEQLISPTQNLGYVAGTVSGQTGGGLRLVIEALTSPTPLANQGEDVTFAFTYDGSPRGVTGLTYMISDIDGAIGPDGVGEERVSTNAGAAAGTIINTGYLEGTGIATDPWARQVGSTPANVDTGDTDGSVVMLHSGTPTSFLLRFRNYTTNTGAHTIFVTPFNFTVTNPAC